MSVTWFFLLLKKYRKLKWFSLEYQIFSDFIFSLSTEIWEPKCQNSFQPEECKSLRHLRNNDRFQVEYISSYTINKNSCSLKAQTHSAQHRMWCRTTWRGWLDDDVFFGLSDGTWWINDVWIPYYWRSVTFKIVLNIKKYEKKIRSDKEGRRHKWHILRHLIERTSKHQNNFNSLWILIQIFFCVSFLLCIVAFFFFLYNVGLTLERMSVEWPLREIFGFGYFYRNEFFLSISKTS